MEPYIGITDFMSAGEVREMLAVFNQNKHRESNRRLMVGVMTSRKKLLGLRTKWQNAFPQLTTIAEIFCSDEAHNCLHYADYTEDPELWKNLAHALSYCGIGLHSLQLDMIWPDPGQVANGVYTSRRQIEVILQINKDALSLVDNDPKTLVKKLDDYQGIVHRVLLDKSVGRGIGLDETVLRPFIEELTKQTPWLQIGVAGGLGPNSMHLVEGLARDYPSISIDAQGQLRPSGNALDPIDWSLAAEYLRQALKIFS